MSDKFKKYAEQSLKEAAERKKNKSVVKKKKLMVQKDWNPLVMEIGRLKE